MGEFGSTELYTNPLWVDVNQSDNNQAGVVAQIVKCKFGTVFGCITRLEVPSIRSTQSKCYGGIGRLGYATYPIIECTYFQAGQNRLVKS